MNKVFKNFIGALGANCCNFESRASRKEFWMYAVTLGVLLTIAYGVIETLTGAPSSGILSTSRIIEGVVSLLLLCPTLAISVRRLHDINRSGWWLLFNVVPCIGQFTLFYWFLKKGDEGSNRYGCKPEA